MKPVEIAKTIIQCKDSDNFLISSIKAQFNEIEIKSGFVKKVLTDQRVKNFEISYISKFKGNELVIASFLNFNKGKDGQGVILYDDEDIESSINKLISSSLDKKNSALEDYQNKIIEHADDYEAIESAYKNLPNLLFAFSKSSIPTKIEVFGKVYSVPVPDKSIINMPVPKNYQLELSGLSRIRNITVDENAAFFVDIDCKIKKTNLEIKTKCHIRNSVLIKILNDIEINKNCYGQYSLDFDGEYYSLVDFSLVQQNLELVL